MIFTKDKCNIKFNEMTFDDFVNYLKKINFNLNYENDNIINKLKEFYENHKKYDDSVKLPLRTTLKKFMNIKQNSVEELGYDMKNKTYTFFNVEYKSKEKPKCNICGSDLVFRKKRNGVFCILKCSNEKCISKQKKYKTKAFLSQEALEEVLTKIKKRNILCVDYYLNKGYSEEDAIKIISEEQAKRSKMSKKEHVKINKEYITKKYGEEYAKQWAKKRSRFCVEYWLERGYNEEDAIKEISRIQSEFANRLAKKTKENPHRYKTKNNRCIEYWLEKGYSEEDAKEEQSKIQLTFSKEKCIEKYGEEKGIERWKERQEKWQKSLHDNGNVKIGYSKISQELFNEIMKFCPDSNQVYYATKNKEYAINYNKKNYVFDFCDLEKRKIIEFNGDIYHANPKIFKEDDTPNPYENFTSKFIWDRDENKRKVAKTNDFEVLTIWESDYRNDKNKELEKCLEFLNYEKKII